MCPRSCANPSETSIAALATPRRCRVRRLREPERGAAQFSRYPDVVAGQGAGPVEREPARHFAQDGDADRKRAGRRRARGIAADQLDAEARGEREEALRESVQPRFVRGRQRKGERRPARRSAHRRHVGKVHRERLVAELARVRPGAEMASFQQQVGGHREFHARRRPQQRRVVAHAQHSAARGLVEILPDQFEF